MGIYSLEPRSQALPSTEHSLQYEHTFPSAFLRTFLQVPKLPVPMVCSTSKSSNLATVLGITEFEICHQEFQKWTNQIHRSALQGSTTWLELCSGRLTD